MPSEGCTGAVIEILNVAEKFLTFQLNTYGMNLSQFC